MHELFRSIPWFLRAHSTIVWNSLLPFHHFEEYNVIDTNGQRNGKQRAATYGILIY